jgi:hypothetical protein
VNFILPNFLKFQQRMFTICKFCCRIYGYNSNPRSQSCDFFFFLKYTSKRDFLHLSVDPSLRFHLLHTVLLGGATTCGFPDYLSIFVPVAPTWSTGHPWNASFHFSFLNLNCRLETLDGGSARRKTAIYTGQHKHRINAGKHPCLECDSNPWSQCSSERIHFMP